jgi:hypothetical protein
LVAAHKFTRLKDFKILTALLRAAVTASVVMAGLVPAIHEFLSSIRFMTDAIT